MIQTAFGLDNIEYTSTGQEQVWHLTPSVKHIKENQEVRIIPLPTLVGKQSTPHQQALEGADPKQETTLYLKPIKSQSRFTALQLSLIHI